MNRSDFIKNSLVIGGLSILPTNAVFSQNIAENGIDKLVDKDGNFCHQPLPATDFYTNNRN